MTFSRSKSLLIILSLISLVLVAVLVLGVYTIRAKNEETSELLNLADQETELEVIARSIKQIQQDSLNEIKDFNELVLSDDRLVSLIEDVEGAARTLGLTADILSVDENGGGDSSEARTVKLSLEAEGSWSEILTYLRAIESLPHRVIMESISFSRNQEAWEARMIFSLNLFD